MYYTFETTVPTKINSVKTYKERVKEIFFGQLKNVFEPARFANIFFWLICFLTIPMSLMYIVFCFAEIVFDTLFFPLLIVPYLRVIPYFITMLIYGFGAAIGLFAMVPLTYEKDKIVH